MMTASPMFQAHLPLGNHPPSSPPGNSHAAGQTDFLLHKTFSQPLHSDSGTILTLKPSFQKLGVASDPPYHPLSLDGSQTPRAHTFGIFRKLGESLRQVMCPRSSPTIMMGWMGLNCTWVILFFFLATTGWLQMASYLLTAKSNTWACGEVSVTSHVKEVLVSHLGLSGNPTAS